MYDMYPGIEIEGTCDLESLNQINDSEPSTMALPRDTKIIKNGKALILWNKRMNKKVVVKRCESDMEDLEKALAIAILKWNGITNRDLKRLRKKIDIFK
ncbi:hypothetical protein [Veillonella sp.]|uniref:hypothetical protein n=1 Tax=Veillonella sp. TaxID=1926307 RepID=UPI0025F2A98F|nr:hypothetical protein [Veillonella sp.]